MTKLWAVAPGIALAVATASCHGGDWAFHELDVTSPEAQRYISQAKASPLRVKGLSDLPSSGKLSKGVPRRPGAGKWDPSIAFSVFWHASSRSAEWDFRLEGGLPVLVCWAEWQHSRRLVSSPAVDNGRQFYEQLKFTSGSGGACGYEGGFIVRHWSAAGIQVVPLDAVPGIVSDWAEGAAGRRRTSG